jgi:hypothetical protein
MLQIIEGAYPKQPKNRVGKGEREVLISSGLKARKVTIAGDYGDYVILRAEYGNGKMVEYLFTRILERNTSATPGKIVARFAVLEKQNPGRAWLPLLERYAKLIIALQEAERETYEDHGRLSLQRIREVLQDD